MAQASPVFDSSPVTSATYNTVYTYNITTSDPVENDDRFITITSGSLPAGLTFTDNGDGTAMITGTVTETGDFPIELTVEETDDNTMTGVQSFTIMVAKATATITLSDLSQTYDATSKSVSVVTIPAGLTVDILYYGAVALPVDAGSYPVEATINDANYEGTTTETFTIDKVLLTVTADNKSKTYGNENPPFTISYSGFVGGEDEAVLSSLPTAGSAATAASSVGDYAIDITGGAADNYDLNRVAGTLSVLKAPLSVTADDQAKTYGDPNPSLTITYSGLVNGDDAGDLNTVPTAMTAATGSSDAGSYLIIPSGGSDDNYFFDYNNGTLTVSKAILNAQADDKGRLYGESNPVFTINYSGFVNNDDEASLNAVPIASTTATATSDVGNYSITVSGGSDNNYSYNRVNGNLTVDKATATVSVNNDTYTYDGAPKTASGTTTPSGLTVDFTYDGSAASPVDAGTYAVAGTIDDINYEGMGSGSLTINKATAIIALVDLDQNFDGSPKPVTAATNPSSLAVNFTYNGSAVAPSAVGSYAVVATVADKNYEGTATGTLIINGAPATSGITDISVNEDSNNETVDLYSAFEDTEDTDAGLAYTIQNNSHPTLFAEASITAGQLTLDFAENQNGNSVITIRATDSGGLFVETSFNVIVAPVQDAPFFDSSPITAAIQDQPYTYTITTEDYDATDDLTITNVIALPSWLSLTDNGDGTAMLSGTPTNADADQIFGIALAVSDGNTTVNQFFNITVSNSNDIPFFTSTPQTSATQDIVYSYFITADDEDEGDNLTITAPTLPEWLNITDNGEGTATLSGTPDNSDIGNNQVRLRVTDNALAYENQDFTIVVSNANDAPSFTSSPVTTVQEDVVYTYNITTTDPDTGDELELRVLSKPDWLNLIDNEDGSGVLTGTPLNENVGSVSVVLNVRDQDNANGNQNFTITVSNTNDSPQFTSTPVTAALQDVEYLYNITTSDVDVGDTRSITATMLPSWLSLLDNGNGSATLGGTPENGDLGTNTVTLVVEDAAGATAQQPFSINVDNANDPPSFTSSPITSATEDVAYTYTINTMDPDIGDTRSITSLSRPGWLTLIDNGDGTAILSGTPDNNDIGNASVVLQVTDALNAGANQNFTISVANVNDDPVFLSTPVTSAVQGIPYTYSISTDDPDLGDQVMLSATILPDWLTFNSNGDGTGTLSGAPTNSDLGANIVRLVARDDNGGERPQVFTITVNNTNDPPAFTSEPIITANEDDVYLYDITTTDEDTGDVLEIEGLVVPPWLTLTDNGNGTATLSGTPINANVGISDVVIQVEDAQGAGVNQNFSINVVNTNDPPVFVSGPVTGAIQDQAYSYNIVTSDVDLSDTRTIVGVVIPAWLTLSDNGNGTATLTGTPSDTHLGTNNVRIEVEDAAGAATQQSFIINVDNQNDPPSFTSAPVTVVNEDQLYSYSVSTADPDVGDTRSITSLSKPDWLALTDNGDGTGVLAGMPTNDNIGNFTVVLNVADAVGANVNQNFTVSVVNTNDPPYFITTPGPIAVQDAEYNYSINTADPDVGDTRTLTAIMLPDWLTFVPGANGTGQITGTPSNDDLGEHQVVLNVKDAAGAAVDQVFPINVDNSNDPPSFISSPITSAQEDETYTYNIVTADPDVGDVQLITALSKPDWLILADNGDGTATLSGTPANNDVGTANVVLNVEDGLGANVNQNFSINVTNTNDAPAFVSNPVTGAIQDVQYTYTIQANDPDNGDGLILSVIQKPDWLSFTDNGDGTALLQGTPTNEDLGSNAVSLRVIDVDGAAVNQVFTINVDNQNDPPSFTSSPVISVHEDAQYVYNITTLDPDIGDTRSITSLSLPAWLNLTDNGDGTAVLSGAPTNAEVGVLSVVLNVEDALGLSVTQNFTITVNNVNDAPFFTSSPVTNAQQDDLYQYNINTSDPDAGDFRGISISGLPDWLSFTDNEDGTAVLSGTPDNDDAGSYDVTLTVEDVAGAAAQQLFTITVNDANDAPFFMSSPSFSVNEDSPYSYSIVTNDPDAGDELSIIALSKPTWLTLTDNGDGTAELTGTPANANVGANDVVLNVGDLAGANVNQSFTIMVNNVNDAPVFTSVPLTTAQQDLTYTYNITTDDPDNGDVLSIIAAEALPSWLSLIDNGDGTAVLSGTPKNTDLGVHSISLVVTDLPGIEDTQTFTIEVDNLNDPPTFTSTAITSIDEDDTYLYNITAQDPDVGEDLEIFVVDKPSWLSFEDNGDGTAVLTGMPTNNQVGIHAVKLRVTDAGGLTGQQNFDLTVTNTNDLPVFVSSPTTEVNEDESYLYTIEVNEVDVSDIIIVSVSSLPAWLNFTDEGEGIASLSGTPGNDNVGSYEITLQADDGNGEVVTQRFTITVINTNDNPVFRSSPLTTVNQDDLYLYDISVTDEDANDEIAIAASGLPEWLTLTDNGEGSAILEGTPANSDVGTTTITITANDSNGGESEQSFGLEVINVNDPPYFVSEPVAKVAIGDEYTYQIETSDPDEGDILTLTISQLPSFLAFTNTGNGNGILSGTINEQIFNEQNVVIVVEDTEGIAVEQNFMFVVNTPPTLNDFEIVVNEDEQYVFNNDFSENFQDADGDMMEEVVITSLPTNGELIWNGSIITGPQALTASGGSLQNLLYVPNADFNGKDGFQYNAYDGTSYANNEVDVNIIVNTVNDAPVLSANGELSPLFYSLADPGIPIIQPEDDFRITDVDSRSIFSARISITENLSSGDLLAIDESLVNGRMSVSYMAQTGTLLIEGKALLGEFENMLSNVKYSSALDENASITTKKLEISVNDSLSVSNTLARSIIIEEVFPELEIVSAFTPNGDNVNDTWDFVNLQFYSNVEIVVFEPGGTVVFNCTGNNCEWDGTNDGTELPGGTYFYTIGLDSGRRKYQGTVTILK